MVEIITGRAGSGKTTAVIEAIGQNAKQKIPGQILLVPEQNSYNAERDLCLMLGNSISLYAEVMTFKSLSRRVFTEFGGLDVTPLDESGRLLTLRLALEQVKDNLKVYRHFAPRPDFLKKLSAVLTELKSYNIMPHQLLLQDAPESPFVDKLWDINLIYQAYNALFEGNLNDPSDILALLFDKLSEGDFFAGRLIYIDDFNGFTPTELKIIDLMTKSAQKLSITLCHDNKDYESDVFSHTQNTLGDILLMCRKNGTPVKINAMQNTSKHFYNTSSLLAQLERHLYDYAFGGSDVFDESVKIISAQNTYTECELVAGEIKRLVKEHGYRYKEIAVTSRELDKYSYEIPAVFEKFEVPHFLDVKDDILDKVPVSMLVSALDACRNNFRLADMLRLAKSGLARLDIHEGDMLENYALVWNLNGNDWNPPEGFTRHPEGYGKEFTPKSQVLLEELEALRRKLVDPLLVLRTSSAKSTAREISHAIWNYLLEVDMERQLLSRASELEESGRPRLAAQYLQLWNIILDALEQCVLILDNAILPFSEFAELLTLVLREHGVSTIPTTLDTVTVGEAGRMRFDRPKALFVLGALDGVFPKNPIENGILTSADRKRLLRESGLRLAPFDDELISREQLTVYQVLSAPSHRLILSFPREQGGESTAPSYLITRILKLFPKLQITSDLHSDEVFRTFAAKPCAELAARSLLAEHSTPLAQAAYKALQESGVEKDVLHLVKAQLSSVRGPLSDIGVYKELYGKTHTLSASRLEVFNSCSFKYFSQYGLRLKPRERAEFGPGLAGSFMHYVMEHTAMDISNFGGENPWNVIPKENAEAFARRHIAEYADSVLGGLEDKPHRFRYLYERLNSSVFYLLHTMIDEFSKSSFKPIAFESDIAEDDVVYTFDFDGEPIYLRGQADRVDLWEHEGQKYIRVIDYKTGNYMFDYTWLSYGLGVQLLLYLFALISKNPDMRPAGILYIKSLKEPVSKNVSEAQPTKSNKEETGRSGVLIDDLTVLNAMENVEGDENPLFLPISYKGKEGSRSIHRGNNVIVSSEEFQLLKSHVDAVLKEMIKRLKDGDVECNPYFYDVKACDRCPYLRFCQFDPRSSKDNYRVFSKVKKVNFFSAIINADKKEEFGNALDK